jgi:formylglycine-generating enzyme required for sulfatase activity
VPDHSASIFKLTPAARSSLIIGFLFSSFILLAVFGVAREAQRIKREREQTKALNSQAGAGEMVWIPTGKMTMGAIDGAPDEMPMHDVRLSGFWMDRDEVTNEQFARFVKETGYVTLAEKTHPDGANEGGWIFLVDDSGARWKKEPGANWRHPDGPASNIDGQEKLPVVQVCWEDAVAFGKWAGKRLPTEAEWEYAARGGAMHMPYVWGRDLTPGGAWFANAWQGMIGGKEPPVDGFAGRAPVGSFRVNDYGLADMAGNVWEWTADWFHPDYYAKTVRKDPPGPLEGFDPEEPTVPKRVARGGSYLSSETNGAGYRPSARKKVPPAFASSELGFRCARSAK